MNEKSKGEGFMSLKSILIILGLSIGMSLAYNLGKSIFGTAMTVTSVVESFAIALIAQFIFHFFVYLNNKKKK